VSGELIIDTSVWPRLRRMDRGVSKGV